MTRLQVELAKAHKRITRAVRRYVECEKVTVSYSIWAVNVHVWQDDKIIIAVYPNITNPTTNQIVQTVHAELGRKS